MCPREPGGGVGWNAARAASGPDGGQEGRGRRPQHPTPRPAPTSPSPRAPERRVSGRLGTTRGKLRGGPREEGSRGAGEEFPSRDPSREVRRAPLRVLYWSRPRSEGEEAWRPEQGPRRPSRRPTGPAAGPREAPPAWSTAFPTGLAGPLDELGFIAPWERPTPCSGLAEAVSKVVRGPVDTLDIADL